MKFCICSKRWMLSFWMANICVIFVTWLFISSQHKKTGWTSHQSVNSILSLPGVMFIAGNYVNLSCQCSCSAFLSVNGVINNVSGQDHSTFRVALLLINKLKLCLLSLDNALFHLHIWEYGWGSKPAIMFEVQRTVCHLLDSKINYISHWNVAVFSSIAYPCWSGVVCDL